MGQSSQRLFKVLAIINDGVMVGGKTHPARRKLCRIKTQRAVQDNDHTFYVMQVLTKVLTEDN